MDRVAVGLVAKCIDDCNIYDLKIVDFYEDLDEINIKTSVCHTGLKRGWIGDLCFETHGTRELYGFGDVEPIRDVRRNVLLARVDIHSAAPGEPVVFNYKFLKE